MDMVLKPACEWCGSPSDLYCTGYKQMTLCRSCGVCGPVVAELVKNMKTLGMGDVASSSSQLISNVSAPTTSGPFTPPVSEEEIRTVLAIAPVSTQDLVSRFKSRLRSQEDKVVFAEILRKISKIRKISGHNYVVIREE